VNLYGLTMSLRNLMLVLPLALTAIACDAATTAEEPRTATAAPHPSSCEARPPRTLCASSL